uniref:Uncharacterized protein n=1 Tax=Tetraselmis sp. GSL018 TaxID=582737 RepID=A0A061RII1_9CHLO
MSQRRLYLYYLITPKIRRSSHPPSLPFKPGLVLGRCSNRNNAVKHPLLVPCIPLCCNPSSICLLTGCACVFDCFLSFCPVSLCKSTVVALQPSCCGYQAERVPQASPHTPFFSSLLSHESFGMKCGLLPPKRRDFFRPEFSG